MGGRQRKYKTVLTQIYEIATPTEAEAISAIGVDHIGVLVGDGAFPRELPVYSASAVMKMVRTPSVLSALFLSADIALIERMAWELDPPIVHLGASSELLTPDLSSRCESLCQRLNSFEAYLSRDLMRLVRRKHTMELLTGSCLTVIAQAMCKSARRA